MDILAVAGIKPGPFGYRMPSATSWLHLLTPSWLPGDGEAATDVPDEGGRDGAAGPAQRAFPGGHVQRQPLPHHPPDLLPHH